ncbi:hypothetical protein E8K88_13505 [Lampropedia aestuarii]|uniref:Glycosyltransferase RgtA/B/C/D-like domain-containing protein n=1 Tax=Lampropedia aestuarii TaxID=2562762 RepID=A0A4S5BQE9_9BURK|nr:hypothetical protein [Lampropedia aestuarii]THJ32038.1 hypothetical protein E8K88_13505 [Lampropedia aestuarii]
MKLAIPTTNQDHPTWVLVLFGLGLPLIVCAVRAVPLLLDLFVPFDTQYSYLPLARMALDDFASLWHSELMLKTAPGAYLYMALMQADMETIKAGNLAMSMGITILLFDALRRMAGWGAGALAAWLYVLSPALLFWTVYPMGEPVFIFLTGLWLWACVWATHLNQASRRLRWLAIAIGGLALACATLTRGTYLYGIPVAAFCFVFLAWRKPNEPFWRPLAFIHLIALVLVGSFVARSHVEFGKPVIAAGAGNALYYGLNPIYHGEDLPLYGAAFDEYYLLGTAKQLTLGADEKQMAAVKQMVQDTPLPQLVSLGLHKAQALLIYSTSHLRNYTERIWRIALLCFGLAGFWWMRRNPITWVIAGVFVYQWLVHIPALYTPRYSIAALDLPLTFLAALGGWSAWHQSHKKRFWLLLVLTIVAVTAGAYHQRYSAKLLPDLSSAEVTPVIEANSNEITVTALNQSPLQQQAISNDRQFTIEWKIDPLILNGEMLLHLENLTISKSCKKLWISVTRSSGEILETETSLRGLKPGKNFNWGFGHLYSQNPIISMQMKFQCKTNTAIEFSKLAIIKASSGHRYRDKSVYK